MAFILAILKLIGAVFLLAVAGFCVFGFLASFEPLLPTEQWAFRGLYTVLGLACLAGAVRLAWPRKPTRPGTPS